MLPREFERGLAVLGDDNLEPRACEGELGEPLLGMAFLRRMNVSMSNGMLTLSGEP